MQKSLDADLNIIQRSGIEIQVDPITSDLNIIQKLDDEPNDVGGLSSAELKAKFDEAGNTIKEYINNTLIPQVLSQGATEAQRQANETQRQTNEAGRVSAESGRAQAEAAREAAQAAFFNGISAAANTRSPGSAATASAVRTGNSFHLVLGIPQGIQGPEGKQGPPGLNGAALAGDGLFAFNVSAAGHLVVSYTGDSPPDFSVNGSGHLILTL